MQDRYLGVGLTAVAVVVTIVVVVVVIVDSGGRVLVVSVSGNSFRCS